MKTGNSTGIAIWGVGLHARKNVIPALLKSPGFTLQALCSRNISPLEELYADIGCTFYDSPERMLDDQSIHIVYICTPTGLHYEHVAAVLRAGKHVICEKPLTGNPAEALDLVELARRSQLLLFEAFMYKYHPQFLKIRELVSSREFGDIHVFHCHFYIPNLTDPGFRYSSQLGGGAFRDVGSYTLSLANELVHDVLQDLDVMISSRPNEVDINGSLLITYESGIRGFLSWGYEAAYAAELSIMASRKNLYADRVFSKKEDYQASVVCKDEYGNETVHTLMPANSFVAMMHACRKAIACEAIRNDCYQAIEDQSLLMQSIMVRSQGKL